MWQHTRIIRNAAVGLAVGALLAGAMGLATEASAQRMKKKATRLDVERLTDEQRAEVQKIVREHREASRQELLQKLSSVLSEEQLERFAERWQNTRGPMGLRGDGPRPRSTRPGMLGPRGSGHGRHGGGCGCCGGGHAMRGGRAPRMGGGPGPHMGEFRAERGERMVARLAVVLDLTDAQHEKIAQIVEEHQGQFKDFDRSQLTREERQQKREAHRMLLSNRIKAVLTDDQVKQYEAWLETRPEPRERRGGRRGRG